MSKVKLLWGLTKVLLPDGMTRFLYGTRLPVVDGRRIDAKAQAASELVDLLRDSSEMPSLEESRAQLDKLAEKLDRPCPAEVVKTDVMLPGAFGERRARIYTLPGSDPKAAQPTVLFLHGGGWVQGSIASHAGLCGWIAKGAGVRVISYDYVLAPEHKWPAAPDDVLAVYTALLEGAAGLGVTADQLVVAGDSAGANLTAVLMHDLAEAGRSMPAGQVLIYPSVDGRLESASMRSLAEQPLLPRVRIGWFLDHYLPEGQDRTVPRISPLFSPNLAGQPPAFVIAGGHDPLWDDGCAYVKALTGAGVPVQFNPYEGQVHAFLSLTRIMGQGRQAMDEINDWLRLRFSQ
ncbi:MAG TPA: acetyl hydrolase [Maritimibacter sp.]|nr:acetyl hydrolase [Maritimibacter sp.]